MPNGGYEIDDSFGPKGTVPGKIKEPWNTSNMEKKEYIMETRNDVKGGLVIEQMKRYAKRLSYHTGNSVNIRIEVWHHPASGSAGMHDSVDFILWDSANSRFVEIPYPDEDLRVVGREIDKHIGHERAVDKRSKSTGHMGE
jgi:hypothetical protein